MKKIASVILALTVLLTSIGLENNIFKAFGSGGTGLFNTAEDAVETTSNNSTVKTSVPTTEDETGVMEDTTTPGAIAVVPQTMPMLQSEYVSTYSVGSDQISYERTGTDAKPLVAVTINTGGQELVGITYERGYGRTAGYNSERIYNYEYDINSGIATFTLDNVSRFVSVMAVLYDDSTGNTSSIENGYEITGKRVFNSGSTTFAPYPTTPLTDAIDTELMAHEISPTRQGSDNGPLVVVEDEIWVGGNNGNFDIFTRKELDKKFGKVKGGIDKINVVSSTNFSESGASIVYDGRYVIVRNSSGRLTIINAGDKKVIGTGSDGGNGTINSVIQNYSTVHGTVSALTYDNENLYILANPNLYNANLYVAPRQSNGTYILNTTPIANFTGLNNANELDMIFDGSNIWIPRNNSNVYKYNITNNSTELISTSGNITRIVFDGNQYVYAIGTQGVAIGGRYLTRININDNSISYVYDDVRNYTGYFEDLTFDGRNIWVNMFGIADSNLDRYDTVAKQKVTIPSKVYTGGYADSTIGSVAGVYDGKYAIFSTYNNAEIHAIGRTSDANTSIKYGNKSGNLDSNLIRHFEGKPLLEENSVVFVDDLETTSPDYVDIKTVGGNSSSEIIQVAWAYHKTDKKEASFFEDMNNFASNKNYADWTSYLKNTNKYYQFSADNLPIVGANGNFEFSMKALPKLNGIYTLYMLNADGNVIVESITVNNYKEMGRINVYVVEVDSLGNEITPTNYVMKDIDASHAVGSTGTVTIMHHLGILESEGYLVYGGLSKVISPIPLQGTAKFYVEKDKTKWTEIIKKPYYLNESGTKVYIGNEIATGQYYLVSPEDTETSAQNIATVEAAHINGYSIKNDVEATKKVRLPAENGGTKDTFGRTVVEFEYIPNASSILVTGIEVDENDRPTGKIVYTKQALGVENEKRTITADSSLENWNLVGLVNYDTDGVFKSVSSGTSTKDVTFGTDNKVSFAYTRKLQTVKVIYIDNEGKEISTSDSYNIPLNEEYRFVARAVDGYKLVNPTSYTQDVTVTSDVKTISFTYKPIIETVKIVAELADGTVLAYDSFDAQIGKVTNVSPDGLVSLLSPRYKLANPTDTSGNGILVQEDTKVVYKFVEQKSSVTVKYVDSTGKSIATDKKYDVFYGDLITESARSIDNYYFDTESGEVSVSKTANSASTTITFKYKSASSSISVIAQDSITGEILSYTVENGVIGESLDFKISEYFTGKSFLSYYTLAEGQTDAQSITYIASHQTIVINYDIQKFTVTITAKETDENGADLNFFDNTSAKVFTYKKGSTYNIYAPPVEGYVAIAPKTTVNTTGITSNTTHTFFYEVINTNVNLIVKAISEDGETLIKSKVVTGKRDTQGTIDILDGSYFTSEDLEKWSLVGTQTKTANYGTDKEVVFTFSRNTVDLTVNFIEVDESGVATGNIAKEAVVYKDIPTKSTHTVFARYIPGYELYSEQEQIFDKSIGTTDDSIDVKYVAASGNVLVLAVDKDVAEGAEGKILEGMYYNGTVGNSFTFGIDDSSTFDDFNISNSSGYTFVGDTETPSLSNVTSTALENQIILDYTKKMANITVVYRDTLGNPIYDEDGNVVIADKVFEAQYGTTIEEYAVNIDFYNLSSDGLVKYEVTDDTTISFIYQKVDYSIVTDGVVNVIARDSINGNIIGLKTFTGTIDEQEYFDAVTIFGDITGYELDDTQTKDAVYANGYVNVEFSYKPVYTSITVIAKVKDGEELSRNSVSIQQGKDITVYAPHIDNYIVIGETSKTFTGVAKVEEAIFEYQAIGQLIVGKGIEVDEDGTPTGNIVYVETKNGDKAKSITITAKDLDNWDLVGLYNSDGSITDGVSSSTAVYGTDNEVVFAYTRKMVELTVNYVEDITGDILGTDTFTVPLNNEFIITAKAVEGYKLKDPLSYKKVIAKVTDANKTQSFTYIKLTEGVVIEAILADGTVLARDSIDYPLGSKNVNVTAANLNTMINPRYVLDTSVNSALKVLDEVTTDSKVVFVYIEQTSSVTINYVDGSGNKIAPSKTYTVPYGYSIRETARNIDNYSLNTEKSELNFEVTSANQAAYTHNFVYKNGAGAISVIAKDKDTGAILYYKTYTGAQGNNLSINSTTTFFSEDFVSYYTRATGQEETMTLSYSNTHQEMIFLYEKETYTVTIKPVLNDVNGKELTFYDGSSSMEFVYTKGDRYVIYAPPVIGYQVKTETAYVVSGLEAAEHKFIYSHIDIDENLTIKAISKDGKYIIGSKVITGERSVQDTIKIADYEGEIYNNSDWTLVGDSAQIIKYGFDNEVIFLFERNLVNVTINHITETAGGDVVYETETIKFDTNSYHTSTAIFIPDYQLKSDEKFTKVTQVGTTDVTVNFRYEPIAGNITIHAVDKETGEILLVRGADGTTNTSYTVDESIKIIISEMLEPGYEYNTSSVDTLPNVSSDSSKNLITLEFDAIMSNITVKYLDDSGVEIFPTKEYKAQYGIGINEYAVNIDYYNLTSTSSFVKIENVNKSSYVIIFEYKLVDYTIVTDGVVNVLAKTSDGKGGFKILDFKSFNGTIGETESFDADKIFGDIVGYTLADESVKSGTYMSGFIVIEFIYETSDLTVTIKAIDSTTGAKLTFSEQAVFTVIEGGNITVYAPHITSYEISGSSSQTLTNITESKEVVFEYFKIAVPSTILVRHISFVNGNQVSIKNVTYSGNVGEVIQVSPLTDINGYVINNNYNYTKKLMHGTDLEFVFLYDRIMSTLDLKFNIRNYKRDENGLNVLLDEKTMSNSEKLTKAPNLVDETKLIARDTYETVFARFDDNYVIDIYKNKEKLRQSVHMKTAHEIIEYDYRNITGNILVRAVVEDPKGTTVINGVNYSILAQVDDWIDVGERYNETKANKVVDELNKLLDQPYVYSGKGPIAGTVDFIMGIGDDYSNHTITYEYTADYKDVEIYYYNEDGSLIDESLLAGVSNPNVVRVIKGEYISQYAPNVQNYNFKNSSIKKVDVSAAARSSRNLGTDEEGQLTDTMYYVLAVDDDLVINYIYKKVNMIQLATIKMFANGSQIGTETVYLAPGQTLYPPYIANYEPIEKAYTIGSNVSAIYEFNYNKIEPIVRTKTVTETVYSTNYDVDYIYRDSEIDYDALGTTFDHEKYVNGYPDGTLKPDAEITRAEVVFMLYNVLYDEKKDRNNYSTSKFDDVGPNQWYYEAVNYMTSKNYVKGYGDNTFKPENNISRKELATILSNIFANGNKSDVTSLPLDPNDWATPFIIKSYSAGLYKDFNLNQYKFGDLATRAEVIVMINNGTNRIPNKDYLSQFEAPSDVSKNHWAYYHILKAMNSASGRYEGNFGNEYEVYDDYTKN